MMSVGISFLCRRIDWKRGFPSTLVLLDILSRVLKTALAVWMSSVEKAVSSFSGEKTSL